MSLKLGMAFSHGGYKGEMWAIVAIVHEKRDDS